MRAAVLGLAAAMAAGPATEAAEHVRLGAASSLRPALTEVAEAWAAATGGTVSADFTASGRLHGRLLGSEAADVIASANVEHPEAIATERDRRGPATPFVRDFAMH